MADRMWYEKIRTLLLGHTIIAGSFAPNGSSALVATSTFGRGFTVARTSAGLFTITFADKYAKMVGSSVALQLATGDDKIVQLGTYTAASKTVTIRSWDISGAAETDIAANANNRVHFAFHMSNSGVD